MGVAPRPLPDLVATGSPLAALDVRDLVLNTGESFVWRVQYQGLSIGRAELVVGEQEVRTRFATDGLASTFMTANRRPRTNRDRVSGFGSSST